ncbi:hypothetical protein AB0M86_29540 [Streptomyces sp. NPDC051639]|uniref:hypothetical protein n=1 Tax=Streptomyces sp. NPDC051639 TaxID=3155671 RepID=UPI003425A645
MDDQPQDPQPARPGTIAAGSCAAKVAEALRLAAPRERSVDDHMFRAGRTSFRLQLFTAPGLRAVAVATQAGDESPSLTNVTELCAASVWEQHCPGQELPPVWIEKQFPGAFDREPDFQLVTFGESERYQVHEPAWCTISTEQIVHLVGGPVAEDRGSGYVPREVEAEPELRFEAIELSRLAQSRPFREECLSGSSGAAPRPRSSKDLPLPRSCCWYHAGDWHRVSDMALTALSRARDEGVKPEDMAGYAVGHAAAAGASEWEREALYSLYCPPSAIQPAGDEPVSEAFINGQHRVQAMRDAGVSQTVVLRLVSPDNPAD